MKTLRLLSKEVSHQIILHGGNLAVSISSLQAYEPAPYVGMDAFVEMRAVPQVP